MDTAVDLADRDLDDAAMIDAAKAVAADLAGLADAADRAAVFPADGMDRVRLSGLGMAPFPHALGGQDLLAPHRVEALVQVLHAMGYGDLSVGRLYEGHVNAVLLVQRYGTPSQLAALADAARAGDWSAVWNAEGRLGLTLERDGDVLHLRGQKILCSGAGSILHPLVIGTLPGQGPVMLLMRLRSGADADLSGWTPLGMRSTATGTMDFSGMSIGADQAVGKPGDYMREPLFRGGAWRFCATQLGAIDRLIDLYRTDLRTTQRVADPFQLQRIATCATGAAASALMVRHAANLSASPSDTGEAAVAYTALTRLQVERVGMEVIDLVQRGVGLRALMMPSPVERVVRDLSTYLRQPAPDAAMTDAARTIVTSIDPFHSLFSSST